GKCRMVGYMDDADPPIRFDPKVSKDLVLVSITALKNAFFEGIDRFLVDTYRTPGSEKARLADERFQKLVHEFPADEV
ncbi:MAG TPA: hypothetical protein VEG68_16415, partial [Terriglobales bacterium]|nr:hypothetical protein [Terriglobales bacterium]